MSVAEQWNVAIGLVGLIGAIVAFLFTILRWYRAKQIELEMKLIEIVSKIFTHWLDSLVKAEKDNDEEGKKRAEDQLKNAHNLLENIKSKKLGLRALRKLIREQLTPAILAETSTGISSK